MRKIIVALLASVLVIAGCGNSAPEGITLSKEAYDQLNEAKIERDQLRQEVEILRAQVEALSGEGAALDSEMGGEPTAEASEGQTPEAVTSTESTVTEATPETDVSTEASPEETDTSPEVSDAMNLVRYQDSFGFYGYKNVNGDVVVEAQFDTATEFSGGFATVTNGGKKGTVSNQGTLTWNTTDTYQKAAVKPNNDVTDSSSFGKFLKDYRKALEERDEAYVKAHTHPNVKISFGGHSGWDGLVSYWKLDEGNEGFYKMMKTTLSYGAVDTSGGLGNAYSAPYMFTDFPDSYDAFQFSVVTGSDVNLRSRPTTDSEVLGQATYEVLKILEEEKDGWVKVQLPDGTRAYIYGKYIWSPVYYRAGFTRVDDTWLLEFFVKGD